MLNLNVFLRDFARAFYSPRTLYTDIHNGRRTPSWLCVAIYCAIYVIYTFWGAFNGITPPVEPLLKIDIQKYYFVQSFYEAPLVFAMWLLAAGVIHVLSKSFGGRGNFDTTVTMTGYSLWAPWFVLIPFDIVAGSGTIYSVALTVCILLVLVGTTVSTKVEEGIGWAGAFISSAIAIVAISLLLFTLIR
jgi:hypothetical protein